MRNVPLALLIAAGLSLSTACSFSSSRTWGSGGANPGVGSGDNHGKPARGSSDNHGKPAKVSKSDAPKPAEPAKADPPKAPEAAPTPAADPVPATPETPSRHGREETTPAAGTSSVGGTITSKPGTGTPAGSTVGTTAVKPAPKGLSAAPKAPPKPSDKVAAPQ